ncbi:TPA: hypothetical protein JLQ69_003506 [Escherichia coli]|nr:hypothetical protein [Escherichia coli]
MDGLAISGEVQNSAASADAWDASWFRANSVDATERWHSVLAENISLMVNACNIPPG